MFNLKNFPFLVDRTPSKPLSEIEPISQRIIILYIRNQSTEVIHNNFTSMYGLYDMVSGLEYHLSNFKSLLVERSKISISTNGMDSVRRRLEENLRHEVIAYLNRIGQIYHFATSNFVKQYIPDISKNFPSVIQAKFFRDKHAAHRSIDKPLSGDDSHAQIIQAWGLSSVSGLTFEPRDKSKPFKPTQTIEDIDNLWRGSYVILQMRGLKKNEFVQLNIEKEHPNILKEVYIFAESLVSKSK